MTPKQEIAEKRSIQDFVEKELFERRPRGTDAATSTVIYMAIKTAAEMAPRTKTGKISVRARIRAQNGIIHLVQHEPTLTSRGYTMCDELFTYGPTYFATDLRGAIVPQVLRAYCSPTCLWCMVPR